MKDKAVHMEKLIVLFLAMLLVGGACLAITGHYTHYTFGQQTPAQEEQNLVY